MSHAPKYIDKSKLCPTERVAKSLDCVISGLKCRTVLYCFVRLPLLRHALFYVSPAVC